MFCFYWIYVNFSNNLVTQQSNWILFIIKSVVLQEGVPFQCLKGLQSNTQEHLLMQKNLRKGVPGEVAVGRTAE